MKLILTILGLCTSLTIQAQAPRTILGNSSDDTVRSQFFQQNNNAAKIASGLHTNFAGMFNIRWMNTNHGNGSTVMNNDLEAAILTFPTHGGKIYLPAGVYLIDSPLEFNDDKEISLVGDGSVNSIGASLGTVIRLADGANCNILVKGQYGRVNIKGIRFEGNQANQTSTSLIGLWLRGANDYNTRCTLEDVVVMDVSGIGILNENRETRIYRAHVAYCLGDGIVDTASSDVIMEGILSGFNWGNGIVAMGASGVGANAFVLREGNSYRNGRNGFVLTNASFCKIESLKTDANNWNGTLVAGASLRNHFSKCDFVVNNYPLLPDQSGTAIPSGTYSNFKIEGEDVGDLTLSQCNFFEYESILTHKPRYQIEDTRIGKLGPLDPAACTADSATDTFTDTDHGLSTGNRIKFTASTIPTGLSGGTTYYATNVTANTFQVTTSGSPGVTDFSDNGTGLNWSVYPGSTVNLDGSSFTEATDVSVLGKYSPEAQDHAAGEWFVDGKRTHPRKDYLDNLTVNKTRILDQCFADVGILINAAYTNRIGTARWERINTGPAFYLKGRADDSVFAIQYAASGDAGSEITWLNSFAINSEDGNSGVGVAGLPTAKLEIAGGIKADLVESGDGYTANAYYSAGWKRRSAGYAAYIQAQLGLADMVFNVADTGTAASAVTWKPVMVLRQDQSAGVVGMLSAGSFAVGSSTGPKVMSGIGDPEATVTAPGGSIFLRTDGTSGETIYVKETASGNEGWAPYYGRNSSPTFHAGVFDYSLKQNNSVGDRVTVYDPTGYLTNSSITKTELEYLAGLDGNVQDQIDSITAGTSPTGTNGTRGGSGTDNAGLGDDEDSTVWTQMTFGTTSLATDSLSAGTYLVSVNFEFASANTFDCFFRVYNSSGTGRGIERKRRVTSGNHWMSWTETITIVGTETLQVWSKSSDTTYGAQYAYAAGSSISWVRIQ